MTDNPPPHGYRLDVNESSVRIKNSTKSANEIFDYVRTLPVSQGITPYGSLPVSKVGDIISFDFPGLWLELGQADFDVRVNKFDAQKRFFSVVTQEGHPLQGYRFWQVSDVGGDIVVSTGAVDRANGWRAYIKYRLGGKGAILPLWNELLDNIADFSGGQRALGDLLDFPQGRWVPEKKDEFLSLVE